MIKASFFDWDGTLTELKKGFLMNDFSGHLVSRDMFPKGSYLRMEELKRLYMEGKMSYRDAAGEIPNVYAVALKGTREDDLKGEARLFSKKVLERNIQPYAKDLVALMNDYGLTIAISGAPHEVVVSLGNCLGFNLSYGSMVETKNGACTGKLKINLVMKETKEDVVSKVIKENDVDCDSSFAFGDTAEDMPLLSRVGNPVALNPNQSLLSLAQKNGWMIFYSGDDVVNEISKKLRVMT